jgi:hypothetical protein
MERIFWGTRDRRGMLVIDEIREMEEEVEVPRSIVELRFTSRVRHDLEVIACEMLRF